MKYRTLLAAAVAGTFGLSGGAFAGSTLGPITVDDNVPWLSYQQASPSLRGWPGTGASLSEAEGMVGGSVSASDSISTPQQMALTDEEVLVLADSGIYSDFHRVSLTPTPVEEWDYYVLSPMSFDGYGGGETLVFTPYEVVFYTIDDGSAALLRDESATFAM